MPQLRWVKHFPVNKAASFGISRSLQISEQEIR
jgi:hypothetical protein